MQKYKNYTCKNWKGSWSVFEDELLKEWILKNGPSKWTDCSKVIDGRSGK